MTAIMHAVAPSLFITGDTGSPDFTLNVVTAMIPKDYATLALAVQKEFGDAVTHTPSPAGLGGIDQYVFTPEHIGARKELLQRALGSVTGHLNRAFDHAPVCLPGCRSNCHDSIQESAIAEAVEKFSAAATINKGAGGRSV